MANGGQVRFGIGFNVDKTSLNQLRTELQQIANLTNKSVSLKGMTNIKSDLVSVRQTALAVDQALEAAFNQQLGTVNVSKFNAELKKSGLTMKTVHTDLSKIGTKGQQAFRNLSTQVLTTNRQLKQTHNTLDKMATTMGNTLKWGATSSIMNGFTGGVRKAYSYVKKLDSSLNDIRIVTEKSAAEMDRFAEKASKAAKSLAASTTDYTDAALIYYQQGLKDKEVEARANTTLKAANVTGQTGQEVSEQLTAVWNGYKVSAEETELYVDKLAAVAATTASDLQELSTGMEKVASAANAMGVDIDQLNGHLSTVISVTRQAPESVGTAFKTIYARLGDLAVGKEDEFGVKLGDVSSKLQKMGIEILDQNGNMREMGTVMEEVAAKWDDWTSSQRQAAAVAMAGKRQYNNLIALFDNWDMYTEAVETSANAMGTLQNQQDIYMESADAHVKIMKTSFEDLYDSLLNEDAIITVTDEITKIVEKMTSFVDAIGGGGNVLLAFGSITTRVFSKNIAQGLAVTIANMQAVKYNASQVKAEFEVLQQFKDIPISGALKEIAGWKQQILNLGKTVTNEQNNEANAIMKERNELELLQEEWIESKTAAEQYYKNATKGVTDGAGNKLNFSAAKNNPYGDGDITEDYTKGKEAIEKAITQTQKYQQQADKASNALSRLEKIQKSSTASTEDVKKAQRSVSSSMGHVLKNAKALTAQFPEMSQEMKKQITDYSKLSKGQKQAFGNTEFLNKYKAYLISLGEEGKKALEALEKQSKEFGTILGQQIEDCKRKWNNFTQSLKVTHFIKGLVTVTSAVGNLASAYQSLSNISKIANDESLSASEKATQIIMAVSMGISMLSMGISGLSEGLIGMGVALGITTGFIELEGDAAVRAGLKNKGYEISLFGVKVAAETTTGAMLKLIAAFSPYIAIAALAAVGIVALVRKYNEASRAAEKAAETAEDLRKSYERSKTELGKLNDELNTLKDNKNALRELEKGTEEWNEKLRESNDYVLELIDKYPELAKYVSSNSNGLLEISKTGLDELKERKNSEVRRAQITATSGSVEENESKIEASLVDIKRQINRTSTVETDGQYSALTDDQLDSVLNAIEYHGTSISEEKLLEAVQGDKDTYKKVKANLPEIVTLLSEIKTLEKANEVQTRELAKNILKEAGATDEEIKQNGLTDAAAAIYDEEYERTKNSLDSKLVSKNDIIKQYLEINPDMTLLNKNGGKKSAAEFKNAEGEQIPITVDEMIDAIAANNAMDKVAAKWDAVADKLLGINTTDFAKGLSGELGSAILSGGKDKAFDYDSLSEEDKVKIASGDLSASDLGITQKAALEAGYSGADAADQYFNDFVAGIKNEIETYSSDSGMRIQSGDLSGVISQLSDQRIKEIGRNNTDWKNRTEDEKKEFVKNDLGMSDDDLKEAGYDSAEAFYDAFMEGVQKDYQDILQREDRTSQTSGFDEEALIAESTYSAEDKKQILTEAGVSDKEFEKEVEEQHFKGTDFSQEDIDRRLELLELQEKGIKLSEEETKELNKLNKKRDDANSTLENSIEDTEDLILAQKESNNGGQDLIDNQKKWAKALKESNKGTKDYADSMDEAKGAVAKLLNVEKDTLQDGFIQEHLELATKAASGNKEAMAELRKAYGEKYIANLVTKYKTEGKENVVNGLNELNGLIDSIPDVKVGADIDDSDFITKLNSMLRNGEITVREANQILQGIGFEPKVSFITTPIQLPDIPGKDGKVFKKGSILSGRTVNLKLPSLSGTKKSDKVVTTPLDSGGGGEEEASTPVETGDGGGGGSKDKEKKDKSEIEFDRYRKVNNELQKIENRLERLSNAQEKLYGSRLLTNLNNQTKALKDQVKWSEKKLEIAKKEKKELRNSLKKQGVKFKNGEITNYKAAIKAEEKEYNALITKFNKMSAEEQDSKAGKALEKKIEKRKKKLDELQEDMERYEELVYDEIPEIKESIREAAYEQIEIEIDKFKVEGKLYLDMSDALAHLAEFKTKMIETMSYEDLGIGYTKTKAVDSEGKSLERFTKDENGKVVTEDQYVDLALGGGGLLAQAKQLRKTSAISLRQVFGHKTNLKGEFVDENGKVTSDPSKAAKNEAYMLKKGSNVVDEKTRELSGLTQALKAYEKDPKNYKGRFAAKDKDGNILKDENGNVIFDQQGFRDAIIESRDELEAQIEIVDEAYAKNREALLETIDLIGEAFSQQMETYDFINDRIETQIEAAKLLANKDGWKDTWSEDGAFNEANATENARYNQYEGLQGYYSQISANAEAKVSTAKQSMDLAYQNMNNKDLTPEEREKWKELYKQSVEDYENANKEAIQAYRAENENLVRAQADAAFGTDAQLDLEDAQWEIAQKKDDKYLDEIEKAYEVQKLSRKLQEDMDDASLSAQAKLAKFRDEELEKLKEKDKLTQYDVDRANKLYEIELKKIALEEAQQNKSKMRLRRDSSGNYSYQFVADEESQAKAQQELEDAQFGLREMDLEQEKKLQEEMLQMRRAYKEKWIEYNLLSDEEKKMREAEYQAWFGYYNEELSNTAVQALEVQNNAANSSLELKRTIYAQDQTAFGELTLAEKTALEDVDKKFHELTKSQQDALTAEGGLYPTWMSSVKTLAETYCSDSEDSFKSRVNKANGEVQTKQDELNGKISAAATAMTTAAGTAKTQAESVWLPALQPVTGELQTEYDKLVAINGELLKEKEYWDQIKTSAQQAILATDQYLANSAEKEGDKADTNGGEEPKTPTPTTEDPKPPATPTTEDPKPPATTTTEEPKKPKFLYGKASETKGDIKINQIDKDEGNNYVKAIQWALKKLGYSVGDKGVDGEFGPDTKKAVEKFQEDTKLGVDGIVGDKTRKKFAAKGFDTGGYTGDNWTSNRKQGKLAFLHEKELVLNASDTKNMLEMVYLMRKMNFQHNQEPLMVSFDKNKFNEIITASVLDYSTALTNAIIQNSDRIIKTILLSESKDQILEQNVHIQADFPNVTAANEIKEAMDNLTNIASQRIGQGRSNK